MRCSTLYQRFYEAHLGQALSYGVQVQRGRVYQSKHAHVAALSGRILLPKRVQHTACGFVQLLQQRKVLHCSPGVAGVPCECMMRLQVMKHVRHFHDSRCQAVPEGSCSRLCSLHLCLQHGGARRSARSQQGAWLAGPE